VKWCLVGCCVGQEPPVKIKHAQEAAVVSPTVISAAPVIDTFAILVTPT
jgi:hypothetical protein